MVYISRKVISNCIFQLFFHRAKKQQEIIQMTNISMNISWDANMEIQGSFFTRLLGRLYKEKENM